MTDAQIEEVHEMISGLRDLAAAFKPAAHERDVIPVPVILCVRLCECLEQVASFMLAVAKTESDEARRG